MNYYVYEDDQANRARIHDGRCWVCNEGKGRQPNRQPNKRWHGPFLTLVEAQALAQSLAKKDTRNCWSCLGGSKA